MTDDQRLIFYIGIAIFICVLVIYGTSSWELDIRDKNNNIIKKSIQDDYIYGWQQMDCEELQRDINTYQQMLDKARPDSKTSNYNDLKWQQDHAIEEQNKRCN